MASTEAKRQAGKYFLYSVLALLLTGTLFKAMLAVQPIVEDQRVSLIETPADDVSDADTVVTYESLSEEDQRTFRQLTGGDPIFGGDADFPDRVEYIQLDGQYYEVQERTTTPTWYTVMAFVVAGFFILPVGLVGSIGTIGGIVVLPMLLLDYDPRSLTETHFYVVLAIVGLVVMGGLVGTGTIIDKPYPRLQPPVDDVEEDATVVHFTELSDNEQYAFKQATGQLPAKFHEPGLTYTHDYREVDYIQSDGEYFPIPVTHTIWDTLDFLFVLLFVGAVLTLLIVGIPFVGGVLLLEAVFEDIEASIERE